MLLLLLLSSSLYAWHGCIMDSCVFSFMDALARGQEQDPFACFGPLIQPPFPSCGITAMPWSPIHEAAIDGNLKKVCERENDSLSIE